MSPGDVYVLLGVCFGSSTGRNYRSILDGVSATSMSRLIRAELAVGKITRVDNTYS